MARRPRGCRRTFESCNARYEPTTALAERGALVLSASGTRAVPPAERSPARTRFDLDGGPTGSGEPIRRRIVRLGIRLVLHGASACVIDSASAAIAGR
jgi:hypothetical protein